MARDVTVNFKGNTSDLEDATDRVGHSVKGSADEVDAAGKRIGTRFDDVGTKAGSAANHSQALGDVLSGVSSIADGLSSGNLADIANGFADIGSSVSDLTSGLGGKLSSAVDSVRKRFVTVGEDGAESLTKLGSAVGVVGSLLGAGAIAYGLYQVSKEINGMKVNIEDLERTATAELEKTFVKLNAGSEDFRKFGGLAEDAFRKTAEGSIGTAIRVRDSMASQGHDVSAMNAIIDEYSAKHKLAAEAQAETQAAAEALSPHLDDLGSSVAGVTREVRDLSGELRTQLGLMFDGPEALDAFTAAEERLSESVKKNGDSFDGTSEKARNNREALRDLVDQAANVIDVYVKQGASADELSQVTADLEARIRAAGGEFGAQVGEITAAADALELYRIRALAIAGKIVPNFVPPAIPLNIPGLASGGVVKASPGGTIVRVGEGGQDEAVIPLGDSASRTSGGGVTNIKVEQHFHGPVSPAAVPMLQDRAAQSVKRFLGVSLRGAVG